MAQAVRGVRIWAASFSRDVVMRRSFVFAPHQSASISLAGVRCFSVSSAVRAAPRTGGDAAAAQDAACATPGAGAWFWDSALGDCMSYPNVVLAQEVLGRVHVATGLPWWATIAVTTLSTRVGLLPLAMYQQKFAAHLQAAAPLLGRVEQEYHQAKTIYKDPGADKRRKGQIAAIYAAHNNCRPWKLFAYVAVQAPIFLSFFFGIKDLVRVFPDITSGGMLWALDLSASDPYNVLPVLASFSFLAVLESNLRSRQATMDAMQYKMQLGVQRIVAFSAVPLLIGLNYPAGVFVYWISNNLMTGLQGVCEGRQPCIYIRMSREPCWEMPRIPVVDQVRPAFNADGIKQQIHDRLRKQTGGS